tara:strand:+ start:233 stop:574 length:342 start_codon:yes stop_codon:yes gene_type:complete
MADRELKYTFHTKNAADDSIVTYSSVDNAKTLVGFSGWDFSKGSPSWSLAESNTRLVLTWVFTDAQADDQLAVHEAIKDDTWKNTANSDSHPYYSSREDDKSYYKAWGVVRAK